MATTTADAKAIGELNREWFDSVAESAYKIEWVRDLVHQISTFLRENVEWIGQPIGSDLRVLDYACGAGIVSMALAPFASVLRGIDISGGMVEQYNDTARHLGLSPEQMRGVRGNLLEDGEFAAGGPEFTGFHIAVMSMALHHVADPAGMIKKLAERLAPGGSLVIVDWVTPKSPPPDHPAAHTVTRHGFSEKEVREMFADAGLSDYSFRLHPRRSKVPGGETQQVFYARGRTGA
ncbi:methyltransferase domain-containing protein [Achaetomium macrosporum]|uniref:Methyltransferase domain-containing protein n=1 Tax=Achaetomium macrosporum TaxID=79813 RepID=A0AAN7CBL4_9PEZI|nr:methyltransferase domain-containing protein [Achaetomium macrosporum]